MKIVYCLNSIKGIGGIQKVTVVKANALAEIEGNEVFVIVTDNQKNVQCETLSEKINFIHLEINYYEDDWIPGLKTKVSQFKKKIKHKKILKKVLNDIQPDVVISVGQSEKFICRKGFVTSSQPIYIRELHFVTHYRNILANTFLEKTKAKVQNFIDFGFFCRFFYDVVIPLTPKDIEKNWKGFKNVCFVPNPITTNWYVSDVDKDKFINKKLKKIVGIGRLTFIKNFKSLINAFSRIAEEFPDWSLEIYGDGEDHQMLLNLIEEKKLKSQVSLKGFTNDVEGVLNNSSILALTSIMEGFPLVMFEAMSLGNTVVSYNCDFGPSFIINDNENGFLVENGNEEDFAQKLALLMKDDVLLKSFAKSSIEKSSKYTPEIISHQWMNLFKEKLLKKNAS